MTNYQFSIFGERLWLQTNSDDLAKNLGFFIETTFVKEASLPAEKTTDRRVIKIEVNSSTGSVIDAFPQYLLLFITDMSVLVSNRFLFLHASAILSDDGAILLCGPSGSGKTTLAMVACQLGYSIYGEDLTIIEWKTGLVWPLPLPFRPRPLTIELLENWQADPETLEKSKLPYRPHPDQHKLPVRLRHFFYTDSTRSATQGAFESVLGANKIGGPALMERIPQALANAIIVKSPRVRIDPSLSQKQLTDIFNLWINSGTPLLPPEIFEKVS